MSPSCDASVDRSLGAKREIVSVRVVPLHVRSDLGDLGENPCPGISHLLFCRVGGLSLFPLPSKVPTSFSWLYRILSFLVAKPPLEHWTVVIHKTTLKLWTVVIDMPVPQCLKEKCRDDLDDAICGC